jgi:hypothetical protein
VSRAVGLTNSPGKAFPCGTTVVTWLPRGELMLKFLPFLMIDNTGVRIPMKSITHSDAMAITGGA